MRFFFIVVGVSAIPIAALSNSGLAQELRQFAPQPSLLVEDTPPVPTAPHPSPAATTAPAAAGPNGASISAPIPDPATATAMTPTPAMTPMPAPAPLMNGQAAVPMMPVIQQVDLPINAVPAIPQSPVVQRQSSRRYAPPSRHSGGVPLHRYGSNVSQYDRRNFNGGHARRSPVEYSSGVRGVRYSEWPSPSTGLTLTEERRLGIRHTNGYGASTPSFRSQANGYGNGVPVYGASHTIIHQPLPPKAPVFNIPDYVW